MWQTPFSFKHTPEQKKAFARELLRNPDEPYKAAVTIFKGHENTSLAFYAANHWPTDPDVIAEQTRLVESGEADDLLPSKRMAAMLAWKMANNQVSDPKDRREALKLYCEIQSFIEKPGTHVEVNVPITNRVMIVKDHGSDDDWENKLVEQQTKLMAH